MFICYKCGDLVDKLADTHISHPEISPFCTETVSDTQCSCGGEYDEAVKCQICGDWHHPDNLNYGLCKSCIDDMDSPRIMYEYVKSDMEIQKDFYIRMQFDWWTPDVRNAPDELVAICKSHFIERWASCSFYPRVHKEICGMLKDFISTDLSHFYDWCIETKGANE